MPVLEHLPWTIEPVMIEDAVADGRKKIARGAKLFGPIQQLPVENILEYESE